MLLKTLIHHPNISSVIAVSPFRGWILRKLHLKTHLKTATGCHISKAPSNVAEKMLYYHPREIKAPMLQFNRTVIKQNFQNFHWNFLDELVTRMSESLCGPDSLILVQPSRSTWPTKTTSFVGRVDTWLETKLACEDSGEFKDEISFILMQEAHWAHTLKKCPQASSWFSILEQIELVQSEQGYQFVLTCSLHAKSHCSFSFIF